QFLLIMSSGPHLVRENIDLLLIDTDRALRAYHEAPYDGTAKQEVERKIFADAFYVSIRADEVKDAAHLRSRLERFIEGELRHELEARGYWFPNGVIEVVAERAGLQIIVDGDPAGLTKAGATRIEELSAGLHRVLLRDQAEEWDESASEARVEAGQVAIVKP